jgi:hypothetical protein
LKGIEPSTRPASKPSQPSPQPRSKLRCPIPQIDSNSLFFTKLPLELRLRVYEDLFGHRKVHMVYSEWPNIHWGHSVCTVRPECSFFIWDHWCRKKEIEEILRRSNGNFDPESHGLKLDIAMLHTCCQAYVLNILFRDKIVVLVVIN